MKILSSPSASACSFTALEPGTTRVLTPEATVLPSATAAAERRSSILLFVQLPIKTVSTEMLLISDPA